MLSSLCFKYNMPLLYQLQKQFLYTGEKLEKTQRTNLKLPQAIEVNFSTSGFQFFYSMIIYLLFCDFILSVNKI